jgi:beta-glucosidase
MTDYQALEGGDERTREIREVHEDVFLRATEGDDFLGVQVYTRMRIGPDGWAGPEPGQKVLDMGYEWWPQALAACLRRAWDVTGGRLTLSVTENGIGTTDDRERIEFVAAALEGVLDVIADGVRVDGYTYWSLMDNFEWAFGYRPQFGLVEVDRTNFARRLKPSASWLSAVARSNRLP